MDLLNNFLATLASFGWTLLVVLAIWFIGMWVLKLALKVIGQLDIKGVKADDKVRRLLLTLLPPLFKVVLVIVILDYVGIGRSIIDAVLSSVSFAIAIALGLSFGEALKPMAKNIVKRLNKLLGGL